MKRRENDMKKEHRLILDAVLIKKSKEEIEKFIHF